MAILTTCCCWCSVKKGSFASGIFTLILYTIVLTAGIFQLRTVVPSTASYIFAVVMLVFSAVTVASSVLLLVGLCVANRPLLLPWIVAVSMTTVLDVIMSIYLITETQTFDAMVGVMFVFDFLLSGLHVYCVLCVVSQYQCYVAGQRRGAQVTTRQLTGRAQDSGPSTSSDMSLKFLQNGAVLLNQAVTPTTTSSSTGRSFHPTDLSSISEEPSSYVPSGIYAVRGEASSEGEDTPLQESNVSIPIAQTQSEGDSDLRTRLQMEGEPLLNQQAASSSLGDV